MALPSLGIEPLNLLSDVASTLGDAGVIRTKDRFKSATEVEITLSCKNKQRFFIGIVSGEIKMKVQNNWVGYFSSNGGAGIPSNFLDTIDIGAQLIQGTSLHQVWLGRKRYAGTQPLQFQIPIRLVCQTSAYQDVALPIYNIMCMMYPRAKEPLLDGMAWKFVIPGPTITYHGEASLPETVKDKGDIIEVTIGSLAHYTACYLESADITVSNVMDDSGYPMDASINLTITVADTAVVDSERLQLQGGLKDQSKDFNKVLELGEDLTNKGAELVTKLGGKL